MIVLHCIVYVSAEMLKSRKLCWIVPYLVFQKVTAIQVTAIQKITASVVHFFTLIKLCIVLFLFSVDIGVLNVVILFILYIFFFSC